jgi:hypothetical protein
VDTGNRSLAYLQSPAGSPFIPLIEAIPKGMTRRKPGVSTPGNLTQSGYSAFTIGASQKNVTLAYIANQANHHKKITFEEEFLGFLRKNGVDYDPRYVWG